MIAPELAAMAAKFRKLRAFNEQVAIEAAPGVLAASQATASAGGRPDGVPWVPKKDGSKPLVDAAKAISVRPIGDVIQIVLTGPEVYHNAGAGSPRRTIIPRSGNPIPDGVKVAIKEASARVFARATA